MKHFLSITPIEERLEACITLSKQISDVKRELYSLHNTTIGLFETLTERHHNTVIKINIIDRLTERYIRILKSCEVKPYLTRIDVDGTFKGKKKYEKSHTWKQLPNNG